MDDPRPMAHGLDPVVHEVGHNDEMHHLRKHEPVSHILRKKTHGSVSVQLGVGEHPEYDEKDTEMAWAATKCEV